MGKHATIWDRIALIGVMCDKAPKGSLNRTAVMKCTYFLQTLRAVPLGYNFTLYSYGPYNRDVLDDLDYAEMLGVVTSERVEYRGGYGYRIQASSKLDPVRESSSEFLSENEESIHWVLSQFGAMGSADLELAGTLIYADRESPSHSQTLRELARRVRDVKPHFTEEHVLIRARCLQEKRLLQSVECPV
jgi:uncharacterized protein